MKPPDLAALLRAAADAIDRAGEECPPVAGPQFVTLDQAAAMVRRSRRCLYNHRGRGGMPGPVTSARKGMAHLYDWGQMRPWLEQTFGVPLPERFPGY